ncbi:MAG: HlyC/CorC family transporter, partial [Actinobacteria bacterium]|nr:HlyC/CorC family transporter [Actinomycetota bacterium]
MTAWYLLAAVGLLVANGFFVAAEFAITAARRASLEERASEGDGRARTALKSITELSFMLAGAQLGITIASLLLGFIAEPAVATVIEAGVESVVELPPSVVHAVSFVVALGIVVFLHMVVGEMAPKNMAIADPEKTALWLALPFRAFVNVFRPFIRLLNAIANGALKLFGVEALDELEEGRSAQDIATMIAQSARDGMLGKVEHRLLSGAIEFRDRDAADVMVPRTEVVAVSADATPEDIERAVVETGHSRFPVYAGDIDHVLGFFHAKDLLLV